ncbi:MAG: fumarylacetoacetate hydrolase family protein [Candidatus Marinimicrobia bacterium]|nr:fumarylacetoacetate hydrolase family protein [Candidatus Neomarinimicrobiota bacterium]MCF7880257.1 fumarylacetoacetate hydrolase family protein [Candidatus Neomarinimicrobiota bacterium]
MSHQVQYADGESEPESRDVGTIYCVGKNYLPHIQELQSKIPDAPVIFTKPTSALVGPDTVLTFPIEKGVVHHEVEIVLLIGQTGRRINKEEAWNHIDGYALGIDFTLRQLQSDLREKGLPWLLCKGFDHSAGITKFLPIPSQDKFNQTEFWLKLNGKNRQTGLVSDMVFDIPTIITFLSRTITLEEGDLIYTGTPAGVSRVRTHDEITIGIDGVLEETFTVG